MLFYTLIFLSAIILAVLPTGFAQMFFSGDDLIAEAAYSFGVGVAIGAVVDLFSNKKK